MSSTPAVPAFVPVRLAASHAERIGEPAGRSAGGRIEIELADGRRVHVAGPVDRQALADVLAVLEGQSSFAKATEGEPC